MSPILRRLIFNCVFLLVPTAWSAASVYPIHHARMEIFLPQAEFELMLQDPYLKQQFSKFVFSGDCTQKNRFGFSSCRRIMAGEDMEIIWMPESFFMAEIFGVTQANVAEAAEAREKLWDSTPVSAWKLFYNQFKEGTPWVHETELQEAKSYVPAGLRSIYIPTPYFNPAAIPKEALRKSATYAEFISGHERFDPDKDARHLSQVDYEVSKVELEGWLPMLKAQGVAVDQAISQRVLLPNGVTMDLRVTDPLPARGLRQLRVRLKEASTKDLAVTWGRIRFSLSKGSSLAQFDFDFPRWPEADTLPLAGQAESACTLNPNIDGEIQYQLGQPCHKLGIAARSLLKDLVLCRSRALSKDFDFAWLEKFPGLLSVSFQGCGLKQIPPLPLKNLTLLASLHLGSNELKTIPPDLIESSPSVKRLFLNNNRIERVGEDFLRYTGQPLMLNLAENKISQISETAFRKLKIRGLQVAGNRLEKAEPGLFAGASELEFVDMSSNRLAKVPDVLFEKLPKLATVSLARNRLVSLPDSLFKSTQVLEALDLTGNRISAVSCSFFENIPYVHNISLRKNPLSRFCSPGQTQTLPKYLRRISVSNPKLLSVADQQRWSELGVEVR